MSETQQICRNCALWQPQGQFAEILGASRPVAGRCGVVEIDECDMVPVPSWPAAVVVDGNGIRAALWTNGKFGCVEWQPRSDAIEARS